MECIILPSFDDGSIECRTFCIVEGEYEEPIVCEYDYILKHHADKLTQILEAMKQGKSYIGYLTAEASQASQPAPARRRAHSKPKDRTSRRQSGSRKANQIAMLKAKLRELTREVA